MLLFLLIITLAGLYLNRSISYEKYERIRFESSGAFLYANLYFPSKSIEFQSKRPLIIYCHGIGSQRDFDLRLPIELTKRGFYVAALDYQGHGESQGEITRINNENNIPALALDCSNLLDKLEGKAFFSDVNKSQIGLIGHSLGGMVVLMNQALDDRFQVTVTWAPLVQDVIGIAQSETFLNYMPNNLLNKNNTKNLLVIMHVDDPSLNYSQHALKAQELTNCSVIPIREPVIDGGHQLMCNKAVIESIKWFEINFFGSETKNGRIKITFFINYALIFLNLGVLFAFIIILISYASDFFATKENKDKEIEFNENKLTNTKIPNINRNRQIAVIILFIVLFIINWDIFSSLFGILGIFIASINVAVIFLIVKVYKSYRNKEKRIEISLKKVKNYFKIHFISKNLLFTMLCNYYFLGIYFLFSFFYPFGFMLPKSILDLFIAQIFFPVFLSMEILYRKIIYPNLNFIESEKKKSSIIILIAIYIQVNLIAATLDWSFFPSVIFLYGILLFVVIQNTLIFEDTKSFSAVLFSFDTIQIYFAAAFSNALGIGTVIFYFIN
ncbi:MAG: membrane protein of unknown function [Promethearchaeota archaeon]|nr:MAG: membrane protein of unknown function [Candidatus Lokiarchaeota archaeon]